MHNNFYWMRAIIQGKTKNQRLTKKSRENTRKSGMKNHLLGWQMVINSEIWKRTFFFSTIDGVDTNDGFCGFGEQWVLVFRWRCYVFQGWVFIFWCRMVFFRVSFSFSHRRSNTPAAAICFWRSSFFTYGFWEGGRRRLKE